jgi:hypothetical protein
MMVDFKYASGATPMDLTNWVQEIFGPTEPQTELHLKSATEAPNSILVESILPRLPLEGQAWLNGLNPFC